MKIVLIGCECSGIVRQEFRKLGPSETRAQDRARTYPGIAKAMAEQWGALLK